MVEKVTCTLCEGWIVRQIIRLFPVKGCEDMLHCRVMCGWKSTQCLGWPFCVAFLESHDTISQVFCNRRLSWLSSLEPEVYNQNLLFCPKRLCRDFDRDFPRGNIDLNFVVVYLHGLLFSFAGCVWYASLILGDYTAQEVIPLLSELCKKKSQCTVPPFHFVLFHKDFWNLKCTQFPVV